MQFDQLKRRQFIMLLGGAAVWPLVARAQQPPMPVIGFLNSGTREGFAHYLAAFHQSLNQAGFVEGRNVAIEYRWAEGQYDRLRALAADLVHRQVTVIAATTTPAALAAKAATSVIPIVFTSAADPVTAGLVPSLSRPGGNATGVTNYLTDLGAKRLDLLHELVPKATTIGMLVNPKYPDIELQRKDVEEAARKFGQQVHVVNAGSVDDFDRVLATLVQLKANALLVTTDAVFLSRRDRLVGLVAHYALPAVYPQRDFVEVGGLMSYAANVANGYRQAGIYVGRVLKGALPADLPVVQPSKFDFFINLKTAKTLGLTIPPTLLALADEVIE
jgi:putative tryptophan/tyrosine transport system substrate-binding protein